MSLWEMLQYVSGRPRASYRSEMLKNSTLACIRRIAMAMWPSKNWVEQSCQRSWKWYSLLPLLCFLADPYRLNRWYTMFSTHLLTFHQIQFFRSCNSSGCPSCNRPPPLNSALIQQIMTWENLETESASQNISSKMHEAFPVQQDARGIPSETSSLD